MTPNAILKAWKPDDGKGGTIDSNGHYVAGQSPTLYHHDFPCVVQGFVRSQVRDATDGSVIEEPGRISIDAPRMTFELGDFVSVTYDDHAITDRVGEIRRLAWTTRGRRQTIIWVQWLKGLA